MDVANLIDKHPFGVVMLVNEFPPLRVGGGERQAEQLCIQLVKQNINIGVLTRGDKDTLHSEIRDGFWVQRVQPRGPGKFKSFSFLLGAIYHLWRRRKQYQIIHAHLAFTPAIAAALVGRLLRKPVIVKFGNSGKFGDIQVSQATRRGRLKLALLRRGGSRFIALDDAMHSELLQAGFALSRLQRMNNGVDATLFHPIADKSHLKFDLGIRDKTVILYIGRLTAQKSLPLLLRSFGQLTRKYPQVFLLLVGDGPDRPALAKLATQVGIREQVRFIGNVDNVRPYLAASDIFVLPSVSEGMSNALLEAMSSGLACVVTRVGNATEMLEDGSCGLLVEANNQKELTQTLDRLLDNSQQRADLSKKARQRIESTYAIEIIGKSYQVLYETLLDEILV